MAEKNIKKRASKIIGGLKKEYPDSRCTLDFKSPHQLLVATILSAQCTDERVNIVTKDLFKKYRKPQDYADIVIDQLEEDVRSTGFFKNKARSIRGSAKIIADELGGKMPDNMADLVKLPGVGRKTASVILGTVFGKAEGIVVDTHVKRLSNRLGFSDQSNPEKIEQDLMKIIDKKDWIILSHLLIDHGRAVCKARKPDCTNCILRESCPSADKM
jgi:endonuclease-3